MHEGFAAEGVELEVELELGHVGGEAVGEGFVLRDADAVGVDHEVADGAALGGVEDFEELRVDGGLAAGDLDDVGLGFVGDDAVEHAFDLVEGFVLGAVGAGLRVADGAGEVAGVADLEEGEAGVLLVVGAEAAVVGAAVFDGGVVAVGHLGRLDEDFAAAAVVVDVVGDQDALEAVLRAALEHVDVVVFEDDLGVDAAIAGGADGDGGVVEEVGAGFGWHLCSLVFLRGCGSLRNGGFWLACGFFGDR